MKPYIKAGLIASGASVLVSFGMSLYLVMGLLQKVPLDEQAIAPKYHFLLYVPKNSNEYFSLIESGARRAALSCGAVISVHSVDYSGNDLSMAARSGSDGVAVCPDINDENVKKALDEMRAANLPVVLVNHNIPAEKPWPFVGTNNFDFGKKAAQAILGDLEPGINLAVVYSEKNPAMYAEKELVEMGLSTALGRQMLSAVTPLKTDTNPQSAEQVIYQLVRTMDGTITVVFTDSEDTIAGTQVVVDLNLVGRIRIIGFGNSPEILEYIRKGIISATLVVDPELIGYQAIMALVELKEVGYTSTSVDIGVKVIKGE